MPPLSAFRLLLLAALFLTGAPCLAVDAVFEPNWDRRKPKGVESGDAPVAIPTDAGDYAPDGRAKFGRNRAMAQKTHPAWSNAGYNPGAAGSNGEAANQFVARTMEMARQGQWDAVIAAADAADENVLGGFRLMMKAMAFYQKRETSRGAETLRQALVEGAKAKRLPIILQMADAFRLGLEADEFLLGMCDDAETAPAAFAAARGRFSLSGRLASLEQAYERARQNAPSDPTVLDYARYLRLLNGKAVDGELTAKALAANPMNVLARTTHALALLKSEREIEAKTVVAAIKIDPGTVPPGAMAVISAVYAANGDTNTALGLAKLIKPDRLLPGEHALLDKVTKPEE